MASEGTYESELGAFRRQAWDEAYRQLAAADRHGSLDAPGLERLATAAYLVGRDEESVTFLDRAYRLHLEKEAETRAARCAFYAGLQLFLRGEIGLASGWLSRARRLTKDHDCVEIGYLLVPTAEQSLQEGDGQAAYACAVRAASIGSRFAETDLVAVARHQQGRALVLQGRMREGLALLDEAMLAVTSGELSPILTGLVYCSVIEACQQTYALNRACEWTNAMAKWCASNPGMVAFTGTCLVRRAEILQLQGAWPESIAEARRACDRHARGLAPKPPATALYQQGEIHRLRGEFDKAEEAYRGASLIGWDPQPGLALLRAARGRIDAARASIERALQSTTDFLQRTRLLPAGVEIHLAAGDVDAAESLAGELEGIAGRLDCAVLHATAAQARGAVELAAGAARIALTSLTHAWETWDRLQVPYQAARARLLRGLACRALGDADGCELDVDAARVVFERLGALPDLARLAALARPRSMRRIDRLTARELQVLRLVAAGRTNKSIAGELHLSERTIDRHVSNIFDKLQVSSRAAATARAYEQGFLGSA